ncbi:MAG: hypothetical protein HC814_02670 [Rhodobacteraceae bacterium]|nr:hypothetical protein [Paracoccaceae bacterium]
MPDISRRVYPDRSGWEVLAVRDHHGHEIGSSIYFYAQQRILAAPLTGTPGNIVAELSEPLVENEPVSNERLGYIALHALLQYRSEPVPSLRDSKRTDWVTYRASGAPSVRAFETASVRVSIATVFGDLRILAQHQLPGDSPFAVCGLRIPTMPGHHSGASRATVPVHAGPM